MVQFYKGPKANSSAKRAKNTRKRSAINQASQRSHQSKHLGCEESSNDIETLTIDTMDHHGNGIVLSTQPITIVEGALSGETVKAAPYACSKTVRRAKLKEVVKASADRVTPICKVYEQCGGCSLQMLSSSKGLKYKNDALIAYFSKALKISPTQWLAPIETQTHDVNPQNKEGYRRKVRFAIDARNPQNIKVGYRQSQSSKVVDIDTCPILHPDLLQKVEQLLPLIKTLGCTQKLGHLECTLTTDGVVVWLNLTKVLNEQDNTAMYALANQASVRLICQFKGESIVEAGEQYASLCIQDIDDIQLELKPRHFLQVNPYINAQMVLQAIQWLAPKPGNHIKDFYCGLGNFSIPLAKQCATLIGYEGVQDMVEQARLNAQRNDMHNTQFEHLDLSSKEALQSVNVSQNDLILLDPSREGALALCEMLVATRPMRIVYVSCNANTLIRDLKVLSSAYTVSALRSLDMFPYTQHLEVMVLLNTSKS